MTERWRKRLGDLDKQSPNEDVFERAKEGPTHAEEPLPRAKTSTRIMTAVAAFAVFALAISVFAIPALRMQGGQAAGSSSALFPLWPTQTPEQLSQLQAYADAGDATWALEPRALVARFGQEVLGWQEPIVSRVPQICLGVHPGPYPPPTNAPGPWPYGPSQGYGAPGGDVAFASASGPPCDVPPSLVWNTHGPGSPPSQEGPPSTGLDGAFETFSIMNCPGFARCVETQTVTVYQPLEQGEGRIWAVFSAASTLAHLSVAALQNVHSGATIAGTFNYEGKPTLGYNSCGASSASSAGEELIPGLRISYEVDLPASPDCEGPRPGYVWGATGESRLANADGRVQIDPLRDGNALDTPLLGLTAVPVVMTFPDFELVTNATTSPTNAEPTVSPSVEESWNTITDVMGWTMSFPSSWTPAIFGEKDKVGHAVYSGLDQPMTGVVVDVWFDPTAEPKVEDDSSFPLDPNAVIESGTFRADGVLFHVDVSSDGVLTATEDDIVRRIVASISFDAWKVGDERNGWTSVGDVLPSASAQWVTFDGRHHIASYDRGRQLLGPVPDCPSGDGTYEIRETGVAGFTCQDGTTGNWDFTTGVAQPGNSPSCSSMLPSYPAVLSWDGQLLVRFPKQLTVASVSPP